MMKNSRILPLAPLTVAVGLAMGVAGNARAEAYAYSFNEVTNLTTVITCSGSGDFCPGDLSFSSYQSSSSSEANVIGVNGNIGVSGADTAAAITPITTDAVTGAITSGFNQDSPDAPVSFQQSGGVVAPADNDFTAVGITGPGTNYARGDAAIFSESIRDPNPTIAGDADDFTDAANVAEGFVSGAEGAVANATNTSTTGFEIDFSVEESWRLAVDFDAAPFMEAFIGNGGAATADLDVSFTITQDLGGGNSQLIFNWAPDGVLGSGIAGGTESADEADLNVEIADTTVDGNSVIFDPCAGGLCSFSALSDEFGPGFFTLVVTMHEGIVVTQGAVVPEPGTLALMGLGLAGVGGFVRRSRRKV